MSDPAQEQVKCRKCGNSWFIPVYSIPLDAHNAALAAEREKFEAVTMNTSDIETVRQLREQLSGVHKTACKLRNELAAERAKPKTTQYAQGWDDHVLAARSQRETLVDALNEIATVAEDYEGAVIKEIAAAALSKVKEGKA